MQQISDLPDWQVGSRSTILIGGHFQLLDEIGMGATAVVYKARDTNTGNIVALKVLKGSAAIHPRLSAGFKREAEIGQTIQHPNVVRIHDCGVHGPWIYLVMEYLTGRTLGEILSFSHRMPMQDFEPLCRQLLDALDCVHANGIVHRDLKPANLMLAQGGVWKLMDFGISRRVAANATAGPALGTPDYMSPEQLVGEAATPLSDLFATGILFYEALTGVVPFRDWKLIDRCTKPAPRVREMRPGVPVWLDDLIAQCLAIKPEARWSSALDMLAALGTFDESQAAAAAVVSPQQSVPAVPVQPAPQAPVVVEHAPGLENSQPLSEFLTDWPGRPDVVIERFLDILHLLHRRSAKGARHEPLTPWTIRVLPSGHAEIWAHNPGGSKDTLTVESPKYTSPEMLRGRSMTSADERIQSDLYAAGFILYEQILGRKLFRAEFGNLDDEGSGLGWMEWHSDPSKVLRPVAELIPNFPATISELIVNMTAKDPAKRSSSYVDCIRASQSVLHRVQPTKQIQIPQALNANNLNQPSGTVVAVARNDKRRRVAVMVATTATVLAVIALIVFAVLQFVR